MIQILITDDSSCLRQQVRKLLERSKDFRVVGEAVNGREALDWIKRSPVDVLLLDLEMPVMNGIEVLREIREQGMTIGVLVLSGYSDHQFVLETLDLGANGYIVKEEAPEMLASAVRSTFHGGKSILSKIAREAVGSLAG